MNLKMTGEEVVPRLMSLEQLQKYMQNHHLIAPPSATREECIQVVETYLMEHTKRTMERALDNEL